MPYKPKQKKRPWQAVRKQQTRAIDMSWFYNSSKWRKFSKAFKQRNPICVTCESKGIVTPATVTDHLVRFVDGGEGFDLENLNDKDFQALCDTCHNSKSGKEAHGFKQNKRGMG